MSASPHRFWLQPLKYEEHTRYYLFGGVLKAKQHSNHCRYVVFEETIHRVGVYCVFCVDSGRLTIPLVRTTPP